MVMRFFIAAVFLLSPTWCFPQQSVVDSLESLVGKTSADTAKIRLFNQLSSALRENNASTAFAYARQAEALSKTLNHVSGHYTALENLGWIQYRRGNYAEAFQYSTEALKMAEDANDKSTVARCLNNVAAICCEQKQFDMAISILHKACAISNLARDYSSLARSLNNIAFAFLKNKQLDSAALYAAKSYASSEQAKNKNFAAFARRTQGDVAFEKGNYQEALARFNETVTLARSVNNNFLEVSTLPRLSAAYARFHDYDKAIVYLHQAINLASPAKYREVLERSYKALSEVYAVQKNITKAFDYQSKYLMIHDSLQRERSAEQLALWQARFDSGIKQAEIDLLTKDTHTKQDEINQQRTWMYFFMGCLTLLIVLAFLLFHNNNVRRKANQALELKNQEVLLQAQQLRNLNLTKDKLFSIISHDLRSPIANLRGIIDLVTMGELTREQFYEISKKLKRNLDAVNDNLDNLLSWAQSQLNGLQVNRESLLIRSAIDDKIDLYKDIAKAKNITIINEVEDDLAVVADRNHLGLVIRNLLANAIKFNRQGGLITISQKDAGEYVEIQVADSGVGMGIVELQKLFRVETHFTNPGTQQEKGTGIGLLLAKEFIEKNGGAIWVTSELGKGSTFTFSLRRDDAFLRSKAV